MRFWGSVGADLRTLPAQIFGAIGLAYALAVRAQPSSSSDFVGTWDVILGVANSPQFLSFVIVPSWLLMSVVGARKVYSAEFLIRVGSYRAHLWFLCSTGLRTIFSNLLLLAAAFALASFGLPKESSLAPGSVAAVFLGMNLVPTLALPLQVLLLTLTLITMQAALVALRLVTGKGAIEVIGAISIGAWVLLSVGGLIPAEWPLNSMYFLNLGSWAPAPRLGAAAVALDVAILAVSYVIVLRIDRQALGKRLKFGSPTSTYFALTATVIVLAMNQARDFSDNFWDALSFAFYGTPGTVSQYVVTMFVFLGYAFVFQLRISSDSKGLSDLQLIRFGSFTKWSSRLLSREVLKLMVFLMCIGLLCAGSFFALGGQNFAPSPQVAVLIYQFAVNGVLQLTFYLTIAFVAACTPELPLAGTVAIFAILLLGATPFGTTLGSPFGASSLAWASLGWPAVIPSTVSLGLGTVAAIAAVTAIGWKRRPKLLKGATQ